MPTTHITFAKLAASPTPTSWSLSYNAGNLFAAFSLVRKTASDEPLSTEGKKVTSILQSEFFTLEEKTLNSIEQAIKKSLEAVPENVTLSGCISFLRDSIVYLYAFGGGQALLTRAGTTATLFKPEKTDDRTVSTVSGYLQSGDILLLSTSSFMTAVSKELLTEAFSLQLPSDMAELLTPTLHKSDDGTPAALILTFASSESPNIRPVTPSVEKDEAEEKQMPVKDAEHEIHPSLHKESKSEPEEKEIDPFMAKESEAPLIPPTPDEEIAKALDPVMESSFNPTEDEGETLADRIHEPEPLPVKEDEEVEVVVKKSKFALPSFSLPRKNLFFLGIALVIVAVLVGAIVTTKQTQVETKDHSAFVELYDQAAQTYKEGEGLVSLNKALAMDDFKKAKVTLEKAKQYVKSGTDDEKKYNELLAKIDSQGVTTEEAKQVNLSEAPEDAALSLQKEVSEKALAVTEDDKFVYTIDSDVINQIDKGNDKAKKLVTNDDDWSSPQAISVYLSNVYVLDKGNNILKFVAGSSGYGKSTYFRDDVPSLKNTISMSIDSSVYLLDSDGTIRKFTKGESDSFNVTGLPSNFSNPKKLYTSIDTENLYVLDNGNARIVKLDKQGGYISSYNATKVSSATDFVVSEKDQKIYLLIDKKVYQMPL